MGGDRGRWRRRSRDCPQACPSLPPEELHDLDADPFETRHLLRAPLAAAAAAPRQLRRQMEAPLNPPPRCARNVSAVEEGRAPADAPAEIDDSVREAMRALGYAE